MVVIVFLFLCAGVIVFLLLCAGVIVFLFLCAGVFQIAQSGHCTTEADR
jgi:hypothetical protein